MGIVKFAAYRLYDERRRSANDAMMALLVGANLASNTLQLAAGSTALLPVIFPAVPQVERVNVRPARAQQLMRDSEHHLSAMARPYTLAIYEALVRTAFALLARGGVMKAYKPLNIKPSTMHTVLRGKAKVQLSTVALEQFELLRLMRNGLIHDALGAADDASTYATTMSPTAIVNFERITKKPITRSVPQGLPMDLGHGEVMAALAVTKGLAEQINEQLQPLIPRSLWADLVCEDVALTMATTPPQQWARKIGGFARTYYKPLGLNQSELADAAQRVW